jgi:hypothetical protein
VKIWEEGHVTRRAVVGPRFRKIKAWPQVRRTPGEISFWTDSLASVNGLIRDKCFYYSDAGFRQAVSLCLCANAINFSCCSSWLRWCDERVNSFERVTFVGSSLDFWQSRCVIDVIETKIWQCKIEPCMTSVDWNNFATEKTFQVSSVFILLWEKY